ncbi:MAG: hypothetical protein J7L82_02315 [Staphylothermus sp.]|nr:hypothetical protein [Staphylothermus sp.]
MEKVFYGNTAVDEFLNKLFLESEAAYNSRKITSILSEIYKQILEIANLYCTLVRLDRADAIDITKYLSYDQIQHIEALLKLYNMSCRVDF